MSSPNWFTSWKSVFDDDDNEIENIASSSSFHMASPLRTFDDTYDMTTHLLRAVDDETYTSTIPPPLSPFRTIGVTENTTTPFPTSDAPPFTIEDEIHNPTTPLPTLEATLPQTTNDQINTTAPPPPVMALPLQDVILIDDSDEDSIAADGGPDADPIKTSPLRTVDNINITAALPTPDAPPIQTIDDEALPTPDAPPIQTIDDEIQNTTTPLPTLVATLPQTVTEEITNTAPPPPLMVLPIRVDDADEDSIAADVGPGAGPIKRSPLRTIEDTQNITTPLPTPDAPPIQTIDDGTRGTTTPTLSLEVTLPQTVTEEITNTTPPPLMATPLQIVIPDDASEDSISADVGPVAGPIKRKRGRPKGSKNLKPSMKKKPKTYNPNSKVVTSCPAFDSGISEAERETGNQELADLVLMRFDAVRRRLCQLNMAKSVLTTSFTNCNNLGVRTNTKKRIGPVPGIQVGDIFYFWGEMCLVGLHTQMVAGIDYLTTKDGATEGPLATSVVTSGHYNDETEDLETLIYTGHGGTDKHGQGIDQILRRGNLALEASKRKGNEVRVIRGEDDPYNNKKKIYIYDGLYLVSDYWKVKGKSGFEEFKFKLVRKADQPSGYANWKSSKTWRKCGLDNSKKGLILKDLSYGAEKLLIPVVNEVDENDKERPQDFNYISSTTCSSMTIVENYQSTACNTCPGQLCEDPKCLCIQRNGGKLPYHDGILICRKRMIYECGDMCPCPPNCHNRVTQTGLQIHVEVFKTENCGWGLRSWEPIRAGTFICELVGMAKKRDEVEEDDEYVFDTSRFYNHFKWNYEPELVGEDCWEQVSEVYKLRSQMLFSLKEYGNVSRFMNHSCSPNVMWQPIEFENTHQPSVRIAFFAMKHIPPLTELRYDYGMSYKTEEVGEDGEAILRGKKICHCGSVKCRGSFG